MAIEESEHEPRAAAVDAMRQLVHGFVARDPDTTTLRAITAAIDPLLEQLRVAPRRNTASSLSGDRLAPALDEAVGGALVYRPIMGPANPFGVDAVSSIEGDEAITDVVLGPAFEGAPDRAHGGVVAAIFDDVTGHVLGIVGTLAFTVKLEVSFHEPVPIGAPIQFRARLDHRDGRRLYVNADCWSGDQRLASCNALFVTVADSAFAALVDPGDR